MYLDVYHDVYDIDLMERSQRTQQVRKQDIVTQDIIAHSTGGTGLKKFM